MSLIDFAKSELDIIGINEDNEMDKAMRTYILQRIGRNPDCPTHNKKEEDLDDLAWDIIFDLINLRLISDSISVEDPMLNMAHKFIFKRIKEYSD